MSLLLLVDLDGVVYRGPDPVPGIAAVLAARAAAGDDVVYVTNNSMHYRADYVSRLTALGAPVSPDRVVSAPRATALYVREHEPDVRRVLAVGASGLDRELRDVGLEVVNAGFAAERMAKEGLDGVEAAGAPQAVVAGVDPQLTYLRVAAAADCLRAGAVFIATNRDPVYPTQRFLRPGSGSIIAAIEVASGVTPVVIGKPQPLLLEQAAHAAGRDPKEAIVIGGGSSGRGADDPDADRGDQPGSRGRATGGGASAGDRGGCRRAPAAAGRRGVRFVDIVERQIASGP
jgi:HAD superfamily hydrolase (TIGR01450 family)